ncbi:MAG: hypothetical protein H6581_00040 [Bacteroidia bacterium]|nr:hypothetical protein [Bacteroidia bacterium]
MTILLLSCILVKGQTHLRLIDSYSLQVIQLDSFLQINKADYAVDTLHDLISIRRLRGNRLEITFP